MRLACWFLVLLLPLLACSGLVGGLGGGGGGGSKPTIRAFTATPATLPAEGGSVTLTWDTSGADQVSIEPNVGIVRGTSTSVSITANTIFTLSASNKAGTSTKSALVTVGEASRRPVILVFTATPASLAQGGGQTTLRWEVAAADSLAIDQGVGAVTGDSQAVTVTQTTIYTLTATNAEGITTSAAAVVVGQNPPRSGSRFVAMVSPTNGETFTAPATLRLVAAGRDPNIDTNMPSAGLGGNAAKVQFFVDDQTVLEVDGANAEYWIFKGFASGVIAGRRRVWARAIYTNPAAVLDSEPTLVTIEGPPAYARTVELDADVVLSGSQGYELAGTAAGRIRLNGNGHRITSSGGSGNLTLRYVDVFDLGARQMTQQPGLAVTTGGTVTIESCNFDSSNTLEIKLSGSAAASVRQNTFRSNMRMPIGQLPGSSASGGSYPVVSFGGDSGGTKVFQGNNVGAGWASFEGAKKWLVGGDTDADSNVLIGPRVGIYVQKCQEVEVRRNFSHHVYFGGWSQGSNFELGDSPGIPVEHNVIYGSSWPVRGVGCEFRYNLVLEAGHQWLWADRTNGSIHHNIFAGGDADIGGIYVLGNPQNVRIYNNTIDGQNHPAVVTALKLSAGAVTLTSNLFMNLSGATAVAIEGGSLTADYNLFFNPQMKNYSDNRHPAHDVGATNAQTNPQLKEPATKPFDLDEASVWKRDLTVRQVLQRYRDRYTPQAGSPAIDGGDPAAGTGNDIGAVGAGEPHGADSFGR